MLGEEQWAEERAGPGVFGGGCWEGEESPDTRQE